jgi:hypothetical protein
MKKIFSGGIFPAICFFLLAGTIKAQTFYVSPNGNDGNSGNSISSAWKTISKVNSTALSPGTTILFEAGYTYPGSIELDASDANNPSVPVTISSFGSGKATISSGSAKGLYAYNTQGVKISDLIFEGSGMYTNNSDGVLVYNDLNGNVKLDSFQFRSVEIRNYGKSGLTILSVKGNSGFRNVVIDGLNVHHVKENGIVTRGFTMQSHTGWAHKNIKVTNTEVHHVPGYADPSTHRGSGIIFGQVDNGVIEHSAAHDNGSANTHCGGPGGIWTWDSNNITIQYCESYNNSGGTGCDGLGFDLDGGVTNSVMQYNYSHDNDGAGYLLGQYDYARAWSNNVVRYNISVNDGRTNAGGITLFKGPGTTMNGAKIYNNTVYTSASATNSGVGAFKFTEWNTGINGVEVYNNIFQSAGGAYLVYVPTGYTATFAGNLYWSSGSAFKIYNNSVFYNSLSAWRTATGNEQSGSTVTGIAADPQLLNTGLSGIIFPADVSQLNAYTLASASPARNTGLNLMNMYSINIGVNDFFNNPLASAAVFDIGAHEAPDDLTTGIESVSGKKKDISIYPNPVQSGNVIHVKDVELPYAAELISITGASVWKENNIEDPEYVIQTTGLAAGPYFITIVDKNGSKKVNKLIIQ